MSKVVYTAGVWDLLHLGHRNLLRRSREIAGKAGTLVVGVVTDAGTEAYKGFRPEQDECTRLLAVAGLPEVDAAIMQPGTDPTPVLEALARLGLRPQAMTHGDDWHELRKGAETLRRMEIEWVLVPYTPGISSTALREQLR